jgi:hypothetical protein
MESAFDSVESAFDSMESGFDSMESAFDSAIWHGGIGGLGLGFLCRIHQFYKPLI